MIITAYQTLEDRDNIDEIETEGPFPCNRADAWLGQGYYFWDTNMKWAVIWGEQSYASKGKAYVIGRCQLLLDETCFDLVGNVQHQLDLTACIETLLKSGRIQEGQRLILPILLEFMKQNNIFDYASIRCYDTPPDIRQLHFGEHRMEHMIINQRVQVCVIDRKAVLLPPFRVAHLSKSSINE